MLDTLTYQTSMNQPTTPQRRFRFSILTLLLLILGIGLLLGVFRAGYLLGFARGAREVKPAIVYAVTYDVSDLVNPSKGSNGEAATDYSGLIKLVTTTVEPHSWQSAGGHCDIAPYSTNLSLVISQTKEGHQSVNTLFEQIVQLVKKTQQQTEPAAPNRVQ
jgi:hypothetical protein